MVSLHKFVRSVGRSVDKASHLFSASFLKQRQREGEGERERDRWGKHFMTCEKVAKKDRKIASKQAGERQAPMSLVM